MGKQERRCQHKRLSHELICRHVTAYSANVFPSASFHIYWFLHKPKTKNCKNWFADVIIKFSFIEFRCFRHPFPMAYSHKNREMVKTSQRLHGWNWLVYFNLRTDYIYESSSGPKIDRTLQLSLKLHNITVALCSGWIFKARCTKSGTVTFFLMPFNRQSPFWCCCFFNLLNVKWLFCQTFVVSVGKHVCPDD